MTDVFAGQPRSALEHFISRYCERTRSSKAYRQRFGAVLADSRASAGFRPTLKEIHYPVVATRGAGSRIWDLDGNEYVDIAMGFGVQFFGHDAPFIREAIQTQLKRGLYLGPQSHLAGEVARKLAVMTGVQRVCFCNSGTEAVMTALRLARAATKRSKIAMFKWSYHGHFDGTLGRPRALDGRVQTIPLAPGIASKFVEDVLMLDYGEPSAFDALDNAREEIAAVIVEPVQSLRPNLQPKAFLQNLRRWCNTHGAALIFDEILLGLRVHPGGAQAIFDIEADLVTYGKILGGGLPIGVVGGKACLMDAVDGGCWNYGDSSGPSGRRTFFAGTFNKNPLAMAVAHAVLSELEGSKGTLQTELNLRTARFADRLNKFMTEDHIPISVAHFGSMFRFEGVANLDLFHYGLVHRAVYVWEGRTCFFSTAHSDEDIEAVASAAAEVALQMPTLVELGKDRLQREALEYGPARCKSNPARSE